MNQPVERITLTLETSTTGGEPEIRMEHQVWKGKRWRAVEGSPRWYGLDDEADALTDVLLPMLFVKWGIESAIKSDKEKEKKV